MLDVGVVDDPPSGILLTVEEAAERLRIGRTTLFRLIGTGQIASVQIGRLRRLRPVDLEAYAASLPARVTAVGKV